MICLFVNYEMNNGKVGRPRVGYYTGTVTFNKREIWFGVTTYSTRRKATIFDDATSPPTLIREDYPLKFLRSLKAKLPKMFIDNRGSIVDSTGRVIMEGPKP